MKTSKTFPLVVMLALGTACGKKASEKAAEKVVKKTSETLLCSTAEMTSGLGNALSAEYEVKLTQRTIEKVLSEIEAHSDYQVVTFWEVLTPEARDALNFELNMILTRESIKNPESVYKSAAVFFSQIRKSFDVATAYKIKELNGVIFSFSVLGHKTDSLKFIGLDCSRNGTDLSSIEIPAGVLLPDEIHEVYECKTMVESLLLMEVRNALFIAAGKNLYRFPRISLKKENKRRKLGLYLYHSDVDLELVIKKRQNYLLDNFSGKATKIEFISPDYRVDKRGACKLLKNPLP